MVAEREGKGQARRTIRPKLGRDSGERHKGNSGVKRRQCVIGASPEAFNAGVSIVFSAYKPSLTNSSGGLGALSIAYLASVIL